MHTMPRMPAIALAGLLILTFLVYFPGLGGGFILDDYSNITSNRSLQIDELNYESLKTAALSGKSSRFKRPISTLSFSINEYLAGLSPYWFKLVNLLIHLLCGLLLYILTRLVLSAHAWKTGVDLADRQKTIIALAVTALWLLHPVNLTSVLYVVQRMTSLSALFTIAGLCLYMQARLRQLAGRSGFPLIILGFPVLGLLAFLSKENGALLPFFMLLSEFTFFGFQASKSHTQRLLILYYVIFLALPVVAVSIYTIHSPEWIMRGYKIRDFSVGERLLTQARVLWNYIHLILIPSNQSLGLFHDDIVISKGLFSPLTTFTSILGLLALGGIAWLARHRAPIASFGILFFLTGHLLESSFLPLEMMYEHRNYLPGYGLLLAGGYFLASPLLSLGTLWLRRSIATVLVLMLGIATATRASIWGDPVEHTMMEAYNHPLSPRANVELATMYASFALNDKDRRDIYYSRSIEHYEKAASLRPSYTTPIFAAIKVACMLGKPIENRWRTELVDRLGTQPFWPNNVNWLEIFGGYNKDMSCTIPSKIMLDAIRASLGNRNITPNIRSSLLITSSRYFSVQLHDYDTALYLMAQAIEESPGSPDPRLRLAMLLTNMGRIGDARQELEQAEAMDRLGTLKDKTDELRAVLDAAASRHHP